MTLTRVVHEQASDLAGRTVRLRATVTDPVQGMAVGGAEFRVEDWWDRVYGCSWLDSVGSPAAIHYVARGALNDLPADNEVLYGKVGDFGHLVHISEIDPDPEDETEDE